MVSSIPSARASATGNQLPLQITMVCSVRNECSTTTAPKTKECPTFKQEEIKCVKATDCPLHCLSTKSIVSKLKD